VTVVLSEKGWVRAAKGHDIDPAGLSYKAGDRFLAAARLRSNQPVVFLDSTGRSYSVPAHSLPSARGQGEPLTGRLDPPKGAGFVAVLGDEQQAPLAAGLRCRLRLRLPLRGAAGQAQGGQGHAVLAGGRAGAAPVPVPLPGTPLDRVAAVTHRPSAGLPDRRSAGAQPRQGQQDHRHPAAKAKAREEIMCAVAVIPDGGSLSVHSGKRTFTLKPGDLDRFQTERGRRG
jgi:topoisomerase-4 subunit A